MLPHAWLKRWARRELVRDSACLLITTFDELKSPGTTLQIARSLTEHLIEAVCRAASRNRNKIVTLQIYAEVVDSPDKLIRDKNV